eukprot:159407-Pleurochrysis_carterae.AAC.5
MSVFRTEDMRATCSFMRAVVSRSPCVGPRACKLRVRVSTQAAEALFLLPTDPPKGEDCAANVGILRGQLWKGRSGEARNW